MPPLSRRPGRRPFPLAVCLAMVATTALGQDSSKDLAEAPLRIERLECIQRGEPHAAFTDLARFAGDLWCCFRVGSGHVPGESGSDGVIRVMRSEDGRDWEVAGDLTQDGIDLRDPKLSVTPEGRLMVLMGGSNYNGRQLVDRMCRVSFWKASERRFSDSVPIEVDPAIRTPQDWLWRVSWQGDTGYGVVYQAGGESDWGIHLVSTRDGIDYEAVTRWSLTGRPNETTLRFLPDGRMVALVRREGGDRLGRLGVSSPPFEDWSWRPLPVRLGGPNLVRLPSGDWLVASRAYSSGGARTVLLRVGLTGEAAEVLSLPSGGDTSYPGMLLEEGRLWVSYYSGHEGTTSIYLAEVTGPLLSR